MKIKNSSKIKRKEFLINCSIRGVAKVYKSNSILIKLVWIIFIIIMMTLLLHAIVKILREYLEYNTTIQTKLQLEDPSPFPAITICPYQPFSERAVEYFQNKGMSPKEFSWKLRKSAKRYLENDQPYVAESILFYDDLRIYYQNLKYEDSTHIGLNDKEIFVFCITKLGIGMFFGEVRSNCGYNITRHSSPDFFNCYTINVKPEYSLNTEYIHLILRFPKPNNLSIFQETSLLKSLSLNIIGAQLLVHERGSSPLSTREKIHIEPNRLLQINYRNNYWKEYSTPTDICIPKSEMSKTFVDLDNEYSFSFQGCLDSSKAKQVLEKCQCVMAFLPRLVIPSEKYPYCANFQNMSNEDFERFWKRGKCISQALTNDKELENMYKNCYKSCNQQKFNLQISNIKWTPSLWQLEWLFKLQQSWNTLIDFPKNRSIVEKAKAEALRFLDAKDLKELISENENSIFHKDERYACVVLERLTNETFYKEEKLGLSLYGLVSRVGGSCTLYLGLTCAFFIEILEFIILLWTEQTRKRDFFPEVEVENVSMNQKPADPCKDTENFSENDI